MRLEIRDIESAMVYDIGPDGAVLGRERARTDISLRDESISKRHARIFMHDGAWLLEDLNSSNGTYVDDQRITAPIRLSQGRVFSLAQRRFEVVYLEGAGAAPNGSSQPLHDFGPAPGGSAFEETGAQMQSMAGVDNPHFNDGDAFDDDPESKGIGAFFIGIPKAIGFFLVQAPLMALNPIGRINRSLREQPLGAMTNLELSAYGIVAFFFSALVSAICGFLAGAIGGVVDPAGLLLVLPAAGIAAAIGAVAGLLSHPILGFLVRLFKGESTKKSRTNYIVHSFVLTIVAAIPNGIAPLLMAVQVPYLHLLAPLLMLLVAAVGLYFTVQWLKVFGVIQPLQYAVLGLGAVGVVFAALGFVNGLINAIDGVDRPGRVVAADTTGLTPNERQALADNPRAAAALAQAKAAQPGGEPDIKSVLAAASKKQQEAEALARRNQPDAAAGAVAPQSAVESPKTESDDPAAETLLAMNGALETVSDEKYPLGVTEFVVFLRKRDAIERIIEADPSLVKRRDIRRDYERLWRTTYDIRDKYYRKKGPRWRRDKIYQREKGQEIYRRTHEYVNRIYANLTQKRASNR